MGTATRRTPLACSIRFHRECTPNVQRPAKLQPDPKYEYQNAERTADERMPCLTLYSPTHTPVVRP